MQSSQAKIHNENNQDDVESPAPRHKIPSISRHVRFPEAPDNCTSDELIAAYIASCKLYKTPTVDFLLEQLRGIDLSICNERYSRLCLRGTKLSRFQIETLEEVFRRVHFQEVDLEGTFLDEASATALFDMMLHYETCVELSISLNLEKVGPSIAWPRCITYLRKSAALQAFRLSHTPLVASLFSGLSLSGLSLRSLTFRDCALSGPPLYCLLRLLRCLMTYTGNSNDSGLSKASTGANGSRYLRPSFRGPMAPVPWGLSLHLPENRIHGADATNLLLLVRHQLVLLPGPPTPDTVTPTAASACTNKPTGGSGYLEELDLSHNSLRDEGVRVLCSGLLQAYELQHRRLEVALAAIAQATATFDASRTMMPPKCALPQARGLQRLNLADNGLGGGGAGRHLAAVLRCSIERLAPLLGGLTHLDLSDNPGFGDAGVVDLCDGLVRNFTLRELCLRNVRVGFDGVFALSGYIGETKSLVHLDLRQNTVDTAGMMALTRTLKVNRSLTALLLDARRLTSPPNEVNDMLQILLQELDDYLRRNRKIQSVSPSSTLPKDCETFSPKIQTAIEHVSPTSTAEDINSAEEAEIKEILLDPPKPTVTHTNDLSLFWGSRRTKERSGEQLMLKDEKVLSTSIESNENEPLSQFTPEQELVELYSNNLSTSADAPIVADVGTPVNMEASQSEPERLVEDHTLSSDQLKSADISKLEITKNALIVTRPEPEDLTAGSSIDSATHNLDRQGLAASQTNDASNAILTNVEPNASSDFGACKPEFEGLGDEPPMEFEAFLMAQKEANYALNPDSNDQLGVNAEAFQLGDLKTEGFYFNGGVDKGSSDLDLVDSLITAETNVEHGLESCGPTNKGSENDNAAGLDILPEGRNNKIPLQADKTVIGDEVPPKIDTLQGVLSESAVPLSSELNESSANINESSEDLHNIGETTIFTHSGVSEPTIGASQAKIVVMHKKPMLSEANALVKSNSVGVEENSAVLSISDEAKIPISMGNVNSDTVDLSKGFPIESKELHMDSLEQDLLKSTRLLDLRNDNNAGKLETDLVVEPRSEIMVDQPGKLEENFGGLKIAEDFNKSTTSNASNLEIEGSLSAQSVKETPMGSTATEGLKTSVTLKAGKFDVENLGNESTVEFGALHSIHSDLTDYRTNDKSVEGSLEVESRICSTFEAQAEVINSGKLVEVDNLQDSLIPVIGSASQKSSSEDLLKEAMQQYLNPELAAEVRQGDATVIPQSASANKRSTNIDSETSESDDSLFNESSNSPKMTVNLFDGEVEVEGDGEEGKFKEDAFQKDSLCGEEACWDDAAWDGNDGNDRNTSLKMEDSPQSGSNECTKTDYGSGLEADNKLLLVDKASQGDFERVGSGIEGSAKVAEGSFHLHDSTIEVENVWTSAKRSENTDDVVRVVKCATEDQSELHSMENLSNIELGSMIPNENLHQITNKMHTSAILDDKVVGDMGNSGNTSKHVDESHTEKSVCVAKYEAVAEHSDDVLLHNMDLTVSDESNRCCRTDGGCELITSERENIQETVYLNFKNVLKSSSTLIGASKSLDFIPMETKTISLDNKKAESFGFMDFSGPNVERDCSGSKTIIGPEHVSDSQAEIVGEKIDSQSNVLGGETDSEGIQFHLRVDARLGLLESPKSSFNVNPESSQLTLGENFEGGEASSSVLKQISSLEEGVINSAVMGNKNPGPSTVIALDLEGKEYASKLSEEAEGIRSRSIAGPVNFLDLPPAETEPHLGEFVSLPTIPVTLNRAFDTMPLGERELGRTSIVGCGGGSDNLSNRDGTELDKSSGLRKTNSHLYARDQSSSYPLDFVHFLRKPLIQPNGPESVTSPTGEAELVLQQSPEGIAPELSENDILCESDISLDCGGQLVNPLPDSTSLEGSKLEAAEASFGSFKSLNQIDGDRMSNCPVPSSHEEPSATSCPVVELSEMDKNSTVSGLGERNATYEPSELLCTGDSHVNFGAERSIADVLSTDAKLFNSFQRGDELARDEGSHSKSSSDPNATHDWKGEGLPSFDVCQMESSTRVPIDGAHSDNFSAEKGQIGGISDAKSLDFKPPIRTKEITGIDESEVKLTVHKMLQPSIAEDILNGANRNNLAQIEFDTMSTGVMAVQAELLSRSVEPEIFGPATQHDR
ncbi:unnamed protein product, partial [Hydatigera taeniaeformis]|uniref:Protein phosphatase 1 regulatory subunit 37 n=1 Tax=Hydatigena taeniaeformis TaxID=6205 RepID=A0A0R3X7N0_HYDTA